MTTRSAQRYKHPIPLERMSHGLCPECGMPPASHSSDVRFWTRGPGCDLLPRGVTERIEQYQCDAAQLADSAKASPSAPSTDGGASDA